MPYNSIPLVPNDLVVRVVREIKENGGEKIQTSLAVTRKLPGARLDVDLVRRLVIISNLSPETLSDRDKIWLGELANVQRILLGVWQARVKLEVVVAGWIGLCVQKRMREDEARLFSANLEGLIENRELLVWLTRLLDEFYSSVNSLTVEPSR